MAPLYWLEAGKNCKSLAFLNPFVSYSWLLVRGIIIQLLWEFRLSPPSELSVLPVFLWVILGFEDGGLWLWWNNCTNRKQYEKKERGREGDGVDVSPAVR